VCKGVRRVKPSSVQAKQWAAGLMVIKRKGRGELHQDQNREKVKINKDTNNTQGLLNNKGKKEEGSLGYPDISLFFGKMECEYVSPSTSKVWEQGYQVKWMVARGQVSETMRKEENGLVIQRKRNAQPVK
jgi:hypothetical protein